jgi:NAD(P)H-nitrite reductase large subunit
MTDYVIVGSGVAGMGAAEGIRRVDKNGSITIISDDSNFYYSRPGLAYYLTGEVDEKLLSPFQPADYAALRAQFLKGQVVRVDLAGHKVEMKDGGLVPFDRLLLATGSTAIPLKVPGADLDGVVKLDHMEDARRIINLAKRGRTAVVVGGGITALELAEGLAAHKMKVHLLVRTAHYWSNVLDEVESRIIEHRLKEHGILLRARSELDEILGKAGHVAGVRLKSGEQLNCDLFAYGIGIRPRLSLAQATGIACDRGILVDEHLRTNLPDIFSAGDVAQVFDPASGRSVLDSLWSPAREQGQVAGLNMAGKEQVYLKSVPINVTRLAGLTTTIIGAVGSGQDGEPLTIARGDSETWRTLPDAIIAQSGFEVNHLRIMVGQNTIVGAIVMGDQKLSPALQAIIRDQMDITPIREKLVAPNAPIADILVHFWSNLHAKRS